MAQVSFSRSTSDKGNCVNIISTETIRGTVEERISQFQRKSLGYIEGMIQGGIDASYSLSGGGGGGGFGYGSGSGSWSWTGAGSGEILGGGGGIWRGYAEAVVQNEVNINSGNLIFGIHLRNPSGGPVADYYETPGDIGKAGAGLLQFYIPAANKADFVITSATRSDISILNSGTITAFINKITPTTALYTVAVNYIYDPANVDKIISINMVISSSILSPPFTINYSMPLTRLLGITSAPVSQSQLQDKITFTSPVISNTTYTYPTVDETGVYAPLPIGWFSGDTTIGGSPVLGGTGPPGVLTGATGDYYIDLSVNGPNSLYGPKAATWPAILGVTGGYNNSGYSFGATGATSGNTVDLKLHNLVQFAAYYKELASMAYNGNLFSPGYISLEAYEVNRRNIANGLGNPLIFPSDLTGSGQGTPKYFTDYLSRNYNDPGEEKIRGAIIDLGNSLWPSLTKTSDYIASLNEEECNPKGSGVRNLSTDLCGKRCMELVAAPATSL
jgi:hypothetical protein